jgi:hypothetical protein
MNKYGIAEVINQFRHRMDEAGFTSRQKTVMTHLCQCHTPVMGGRLKACDHCGHTHLMWYSCRNSHCPQCTHTKRERWILCRKEDLLLVGYFHVVFTLPDDLNQLCLEHPREIYNLLFKSAWETMHTFGLKQKHLGAQTGMIAVLHTWGQNLSLHPHVHCLVPAGGLTQQGKWRRAKAKGKYLYPVKALSQIFRGKFTHELQKLHERGIVKLDKPIDLHQKHLHPLYRRKWVVYAKKPVRGSAHVVEYLGRYVNRVAIANSRIKKVDEKEVAFSWKDYRTEKQHVTPLKGETFLKRWLMHILPAGFVKVRHFGILSCRNKKDALTVARQYFKQTVPASLKKEPWYVIFEKIHGHSPFLCPECKKGMMGVVEVYSPIRDGPSREKAA